MNPTLYIVYTPVKSVLENKELRNKFQFRASQIAQRDLAFFAFQISYQPLQPEYLVYNESPIGQ